MRAVRGAREGDGVAAPSPGALGSRAHAALAVAATTLLTVLVAWAALIGPDRVFTGPGPTPSTVTTTPTAEAEEQQDTFRQDAEDLVRENEPPAWLKLLVWGFEALVLLGLLGVALLLIRAAHDAWRGRRRPPERLPDPGFETLEGSAVVAAVREDAAAHDALLAGGSPRNAIVAAWHRFELQAERAGVRREPWETSSEFTLRILDLAGADSAAVTRLGELYREARFSEHELGEAERAGALAALVAIRESLGRVR